MPLYEYRCLACSRRTEVLQRFSDRPLRKCGSCGGKLEKMISRSAFLLKGGGWYAEGYGNSKPASKTEAGGEAKPAKSESASSAEATAEKKKDKEKKTPKSGPA